MLQLRCRRIFLGIHSTIIKAKYIISEQATAQLRLCLSHFPLVSSHFSYWRWMRIRHHHHHRHHHTIVIIITNIIKMKKDFLGMKKIAKKNTHRKIPGKSQLAICLFALFMPEYGWLREKWINNYCPFPLTFTVNGCIIKTLSIQCCSAENNHLMHCTVERMLWPNRKRRLCMGNWKILNCEIVQRGHYGKTDKIV